jgi:hypothetical protein
MLNKLSSIFRRRAQVQELAGVEVPRPADKAMVRAIGFCKTEGCDKFNDGVFLFSMHEDPIFVCSKCNKRGMVVKEEYSVKNPEDLTFRQVRVEFDFRPSLVAEVGAGGTWHGIAIVTDDSMNPEYNVYTMKSPLIKTEKRALAVAVSMLGGLLQNPERMLELNPGSRAQESIINFDEPLGAVKAQLFELEDKIRGSRLTEEFKA